MAQRSARARSKLDKISASGSPSSPSSPSTTSHSRTGSKGVAKIGSGGLLTPSVSSVSGSSRGSIQLSHSGPKIGKSALRSFFDSHSEKIRGRLSSGSGLGKKDVHQSGYGLGLGLGGGIGEKIEVKRWEGGGRREELWEGGVQGRKDLELWFPDGDTLVYLTERPITPRNPQGLYKPPPPKASFRLHSSVLRKNESPFLIAALEESFRERPLTPPRFMGAISDDGISPTSMEFEYQLGPQKKSKKNDIHSEEGVQYRLYVPAPPGGDKLATLRHQLTTRNFFAVLFNKSLVGITLGQTLLDLVDRMDLYLSPPNPLNYDLVDQGISEIESPYGSLLNSGPRIGQMSTQRIIMDYLKGRDFDDVRNWPEGAAGLVVWAERASASGGLSCGLGGGEMVGGVESLWREGFVHCTGMLAQLEGGGEWREISPITKALIDRASLEIQVRVAGADQRLSNFNFTDMWPTTSSAAPHARAAFDKFQKFLIKHYSSRFGSWPPHTPDGRLSRMVYVQLQRDFSALYDYLVDRDVSWSNSNAQTHHPRHSNAQGGGVVNKPNNTVAGKKLVNPKSPHWRADDEELHITDILITFDEKQNYPHMPHPFPLVPPPMVVGRGFKNRFFPGARRGSITNTPTSAFTTPATADKAAALSLSESTNIMSLMSSSVSNDLVDAFAKHEKSISASEIDPHDARKGRWILIYGILQTLATVAVDAPGIRYTEGVDYFLCPKLRGTPPWKCGGERGMDPSFSGSSMADERSHFRSHCWTVPRTWKFAMPLPSTTAAPNHYFDGEGRERAEMIGRMDDIESGDDGDDEMGDFESSPVIGGGLGRKRSGRYDSISSGSGLGSPVLMENKVRWQDAWGMGPQGTPGRMGGGPHYH